MTTPDLSVAIDGGIARIDLGRPEEGNALNMAQVEHLAALLRQCGADAAINVLAIAPSGVQFCRGRDTKGEVRAGLSAWETRERIMGRILDLYQALADVPVPVVACVQGDAIGLGCALAAGCDITLACESARFSLPEIEANVPPTLAMSGLLHKIAPKTLAYLVYSAEALDASAAVSIGLASKVLPAADFSATCDTFLAKLAARPRLTLATVKRYQAYASSASPAMAAEYAGSLLALVRSK